MGNRFGDTSVDAVLKRLDRASPDALLRSLASELSRVLDAQAAIEGRLAAFEALQAMADRILDTEPVGPSRYPDRLRVDASDAILDGAGFHGLEYAGVGTPYRWTGPDRHASIQIFVDRAAALAFTMCFTRLYVDTPAQHMRAFVDGQEIDLKVEWTGEVYEAQGVLPPRADRGASALTFVAPAVGSPAETGSVDTRKLGFAFLSVAFEPARARGAPKLAAMNGETAIHAAE